MPMPGEGPAIKAILKVGRGVGRYPAKTKKSMQQMDIDRIKIEIRCISCGDIVKINGVPMAPFSTLEHRFSPGEKSVICLE